MCPDLLRAPPDTRWVDDELRDDECVEPARAAGVRGARDGDGDRGSGNIVGRVEWTMLVQTVQSRVGGR